MRKIRMKNCAMYWKLGINRRLLLSSISSNGVSDERVSDTDGAMANVSLRMVCITESTGGTSSTEE